MALFHTDFFLIQLHEKKKVHFFFLHCKLIIFYCTFPIPIRKNAENIDKSFLIASMILIII